MTITTDILVSKISGMVLDERGYTPIVLAAKAWEKNGKRRVYITERSAINAASRFRDYGVVDVDTGVVTISRNLHPVLGPEMVRAAWLASSAEANGALS